MAADRSRTAVIAGAALALAALARLPQLAGGQMMPDGDEAILGLMAKRMAEGREFPLFFWGQRYGLSVFECGAAAAAFKVFGVSVEAMKGAMLAIWLAGFAFLILAAERWSGRRAAGLAAILFALAPAWGAWSMKARGGYLTAFLFSNIALWILGSLLPAEARAGRAKSAALGASVALALAGQMIWAPMLAPFGFWLALSRPVQIRWGAAGGAFAAIFGGAAALGFARSGNHWAPNIFDNSYELWALARLPDRLWTLFSGCFEMNWILPSGWGARAAATAWVLLFFWGTAAALRGWRPRREPAPEQLLAASAASVALFSIFLGYYTFGPRYLLPATAPAAILAGGVAARALAAPGLARRGALALFVLAAAGGAAAHWEFRRMTFTGEEKARVLPEREAMRQLIARMEGEGIARVYTLDMLIQWTIMFSSGERILARSYELSDRKPEIALAVEEARRAGAPTALLADALMVHDVLLWGGELKMPLAPRFIGDRYVYVRDPPEALLREMGFRLGR